MLHDKGILATSEGFTIFIHLWVTAGNLVSDSNLLVVDENSDEQFCEGLHPLHSPVAVTGINGRRVSMRNFVQGRR